ncbi:hypothetical protein GYMLUDRAFT_245360 [Collybiopsis luxurians FD-317 M1]|uniref:G domain-containing protein n=1 Tax=Collybiopsis luxurians FD-317 M1 TaxID=944289 RepID=A0A0D0B741_9AGAR|nr:hypothetical protein GYMLUDRAFT_245360 [Collybiopsis luxurians FD-317 M1]
MAPLITVHHPDEPTPTHDESDSAEDDNVVIAVVGSTGSGKSSFIKLFAGEGSVSKAAADNVDSDPLDVHPVEFFDDRIGRKVTLLDTPGFNSNGASDFEGIVTDTDVLKKITEFCITQFDFEKKLDGLIYLHSLDDPNPDSSCAVLTDKSLKMVKTLCRTGTFENVVVLMTFCDGEKDLSTGADGEVELLCSTFGQELAQGGAVFRRHDRTVPAARMVLEHILTSNAQNSNEIAEKKESPEDIPANKAEVDLLIAQYEAQITMMQAELEKLKKNNGQLEAKMQREREEHARQEREWKKKYDEQNEAHKLELKRMQDEFKVKEDRRQQEDSEKLAMEAKLQRENHARAKKEQEMGWDSDIVFTKARDGFQQMLDTKKKPLMNVNDLIAQWTKDPTVKVYTTH